MSKHLHTHAHPRHHRHAHHKKRFAYSHDALQQRHDDDNDDGRHEKSHSGRYPVRDAHLTAATGTEMTTIATNEAIVHRQKMSELYTSLYASQVNNEGRLESALVWVRPSDAGERTVDEILSEHSALPVERQ